MLKVSTWKTIESRKNFQLTQKCHARFSYGGWNFTPLGGLRVNVGFGRRHKKIRIFKFWVSFQGLKSTLSLWRTDSCLNLSEEKKSLINTIFNQRNFQIMLFCKNMPSNNLMKYARRKDQTRIGFFYRM